MAVDAQLGLPPARALSGAWHNFTAVHSRWVSSRYPVYGRACLLAAVFLAPVVSHTAMADGTSLPKITVLWVLGIAGVALWGAWCAESRSWLPQLRVRYLVLGVAVASMLATALSLSPALSLVGLHSRFGGLLPLLLYLGVATGIVGLYWQCPKRLTQLTWMVGAAGLVVASSVLLQEAGIDRFLWAGPVRGTLWDFPPGTMGHSNFAGGYLAMALPCLVYLALTARRRSLTWALGTSVVLDLGALWHTQSRGGMLAAAVGLAVMALAYRQRVGRWARLGIALSGAVVVAVVVVVALHPGASRPPERLGGINALRTKTLDHRLQDWGVAWDTFLRHPVVGTGLDTYYANYPGLARGIGPRLDLAQQDKPHNIYLERAANAGILGAGTYMALVSVVLLAAWRRSRQLEAPARLLLASFLGMAAAYLAQGFVSIDEPPLAVTGWVALAALVALADRGTVAARSGPQSSNITTAEGDSGASTGVAKRSRLAVHLIIALAVVGLVAVGIRPFQAGRRAYAGDLRRAITLNPLNATYREQAGDEALLAALSARDDSDKERLVRRSRGHYLASLRLQPNDVAKTIKVVKAEMTWAEALDPARFAHAEKWLRRAAALSPRSNVAKVYGRQLHAAKKRSVEQFRVATRIRPENSDEWINLAKAYAAHGRPTKARESLKTALRLAPNSEAAHRLLAQLPR